jgi:hypothetical protein
VKEFVDQINLAQVFGAAEALVYSEPIITVNITIPAAVLPLPLLLRSTAATAAAAHPPPAPNPGSMLAQLQLQPALWRHPTRSRLVCQAGKPKQAKHKPQRPAKRKPKGSQGSAQRSPADGDLDALLLAAGLGDDRVPPFHKELAAAVKESGLG